MTTFVVPDLHGRITLAYGLLSTAGIVDGDGVRVDRDINVVQLGDLVNCISGDHAKDLAMIEKAPDWFDVVLVGNHELPYFGGPHFGGFRHFDDLAAKVRHLGYLPALAVGDTLLTHAGVHPTVDLGATASEAEQTLHDAWRETGASHEYFAMIGRARGGWRDYGGITWSDWDEKREPRYNQVHGHTPLAGGPGIRHDVVTGGTAINLDCGGHGNSVRRIVGLWLEEDGQPGNFVEYVNEPVAA